jgi:DNA repair protein RadB
MGITRIRTGCEALDEMLDGGYESDIITTIYGASGAGKTNMALICAVETAKKGKKVIFIDTEGGFSAARLSQISEDKKVHESFLFIRPVSFEEQRKAFEKLKKLVNDSIGLIIVDTIAMLYRIELGKNEEIFGANRELGKQISFLTEIARKKNIPILLTNQVYSGFDDKEDIKMVGGDIIKYGSKCIIMLKSYGDKRILQLKKHRSIPDGKSMAFRIVGKGIECIPG